MIDLIELQAYNQKILNKISKLNAANEKLFCYYDYYEKLNGLNDNLVKDAFLFEPFCAIISSIKKFTPFGVSPIRSENLLKMFREIKDNQNFNEVSEVLDKNIPRIEKELIELKSVLDGLDVDESFDSKVHFPIIEKASESDYGHGSVDYLSISLNHTRRLSKDEFFVIPSLPNIDSKLMLQIKNSWIVAKNYYKENHNLNIPHIEAFIKFNKKYGFYQGDSLGVALTLAFISEISDYFNFRVKYKINRKILFTGIVNSEGKILQLREHITCKKIFTAFYSKFNSIVLPKDDFIYAEKTLKAEKNKFEKRNFTLIPVEDISKIMHHESLIKKEIEPLNKYMISKLRSKKIIIALSFLLFVFSFFYLYSLESEQDFLQFAVEDYNLKINELNPILNNDAILSIRFDKDELSERDDEISVLNNIAFTENRFGEKGKAILLNRKNSYFELKNGDKYQIDLPVSISMWFYKKNNKTSYIFTNDFDTTGYYGIHLGFYPGDFVQLSMCNGGGVGSLSARRSNITQNAIDLNRWYHVVGIIKDFENMDIYLNGEKASTFYSGYADTLIYSNGKVNFGRYKTSVLRPTYHFDGKLDDFRFYNRVLNEEEIRILFHEKY